MSTTFHIANIPVKPTSNLEYNEILLTLLRHLPLIGTRWLATHLYNTFKGDSALQVVYQTTKYEVICAHKFTLSSAYVICTPTPEKQKLFI